MRLRLFDVVLLIQLYRLYTRAAILQRQNERVRLALSDHERDRASLERIETKVDRLRMPWSDQKEAHAPTTSRCRS